MELEEYYRYAQDMYHTKGSSRSETEKLFRVVIDAMQNVPVEELSFQEIHMLAQSCACAFALNDNNRALAEKALELHEIYLREYPDDLETLGSYLFTMMWGLYYDKLYDFIMNELPQTPVGKKRKILLETISSRCLYGHGYISKDEQLRYECELNQMKKEIKQREPLHD